MLWPFSRLALAVSLVLPLLSFAHDHQGKRHHVHRQADLAPRDDTCTGARFTYFAVGLGACGITNQPSDFIVALNSAQFTPERCFQTIAITIDGITISAMITDRCPGCPNCGLDFSQGLFQAFSDLSVGVLSGSWSPGSGGGGGGGGSSPSSSPAPPPPPSTTSVETPTTSWLPSPTTTSQPLPMTTISSTTAGSSNSSMVPTQTTTNIIAEPSGAIPGGTDSSVLLDLDLYLVLFAGLLESCGSSQGAAAQIL